MQERIVEIIVYLIHEMQADKRLGEIDLRILSDKGYTQNEISTAFSWLFDKIHLGDNILPAGNRRLPHSQRVLHESERSVISPEAHGYLIQLRELGLLDDMNIELAIDRIMMAGFGSVGIDEMKSVIASIIFDYDDSNRIGSRLMLNSKDTIH
jgi:Smg protein